MHSNRIINLGTPVNSSDAARYADVVGLVSISTVAPSQTGNSGKVLTTNGTNASWTSTLVNFTLTTPTITTPVITNATISSAAVTITGGTITGITDLAVVDGGTGLSTFGAKGAIPVATAATTIVAQAVGTNGNVIMADSSLTNGLGYYPIIIGPCGRLTLTTSLPVTTADVTGATTVYFTPYNGNIIQLYDGSGWITKTFTELSQLTTDITKSPLAVAASKNYDVFVWNDSGTLRATRGPTWDSGAVAGSDTARGTGVGSTELELFEGRYVNKNAVTNGPAARRGLYVGTIRSDASSQINDSVLKRHVWNNFNRKSKSILAVDTTDSWNYTTAAFRQANANTANQVDTVVGLAEDAIEIVVFGVFSNGSAASALVGVGVDSTTVNSGKLQGGITPAGVGSITTCFYRAPVSLGRHTYVWLEWAQAIGTTTWQGDNAGTTPAQSGMNGSIPV
jgi:hypothetical protein